MTEPPLNPARTQWSDDGAQWWDGAAWVPREQAAARQEEVEREQAVRDEAQREAQRAAYAAEYAAWEAQQRAAAADPAGAGLFAAPGSTGTPPPAPPPELLPAPVAPQSNGYGMGLASFVCALLGLSVPAIALGHVSRSRSRRAGLRPVGWSRAGLLIGYVDLVLSVAVLGLIVWAATGGIDDKTAAAQALRVGAEVEEQYHVHYGTYTTSFSGFVELDPRVTLVVVRADRGSYCLKATDPLATLYLARGGDVTRTPCS